MTARGRPPPPTMIDLDQYMRAPVRRNAHTPYNSIRSSKLVVDHGRPPPRRVSSSSSSERAADRPVNCKRYSHDSGLSDGSYKRRKHRANRRAAAAQVTSETDSLHAFREVCQRTLKQQQTQIERVAALCEQLAAQRSPRGSSLSTTSASRTDARSRHNGSQCKTYKIIMRKLEELNRVFSSPYRAPPRPPSSVTVVDKLVATDDLAANRNVSPRERTIAPCRANIVMESIVQTDPVPKHASAVYRQTPFRQCSSHQGGGGGGVWRALRRHLTVCFPQLT